MDIDNSTIILILYCVLAFVLAFFPAYFIFPRFIQKMKSLGNTGKDADDRPAGHLRLEHSPPLGGFMLYGVNKRGNIQDTEADGIVPGFLGVPRTCVITRAAPHLTPTHSSSDPHPLSKGA